ncbi:MAG: hypothetical protein OXC68_11465 [Aestuariivita sp.]|nr:hypothetical protein [Aestuariivita sp.]
MTTRINRFGFTLSTGVSDRSYGVPVTKFAGLPASVISRARHVLVNLEQRRPSEVDSVGEITGDLPSFSDQESYPAGAESAIETLLRDIRTDELSPREALQILYKLKGSVPN